MKSRLYTVWDRVAEEAGPVFVAVNDGVAIRQFRSLVREIAPVDRDSYELYWVGEWDSVGMLVSAEDDPVKVVVDYAELVQRTEV